MTPLSLAINFKSHNHDSNMFSTFIATWRVHKFDLAEIKLNPFVSETAVIIIYYSMGNVVRLTK